jgi:hypothetical protein
VDSACSCNGFGTRLPQFAGCPTQAATSQAPRPKGAGRLKGESGLPEQLIEQGERATAAGGAVQALDVLHGRLEVGVSRPLDRDVIPVNAMLKRRFPGFLGSWLARRGGLVVVCVVFVVETEEFQLPVEGGPPNP